MLSVIVSASDSIPSAHIGNESLSTVPGLLLLSLTAALTQLMICPANHIIIVFGGLTPYFWFFGAKIRFLSYDNLYFEAQLVHWTILNFSFFPCPSKQQWNNALYGICYRMRIIIRLHTSVSAFFRTNFLSCFEHNALHKQLKTHSQHFHLISGTYLFIIHWKHLFLFEKTIPTVQNSFMQAVHFSCSHIAGKHPVYARSVFCLMNFALYCDVVRSR